MSFAPKTYGCPSTSARSRENLQLDSSPPREQAGGETNPVLCDTVWQATGATGSRTNSESKGDHSASHPQTSFRGLLPSWGRLLARWLAEDGEGCPSRKLQVAKEHWHPEHFPHGGLHTWTPAAYVPRGGGQDRCRGPQASREEALKPSGRILRCQSWGRESWEAQPSQGLESFTLQEGVEEEEGEEERKQVDCIFCILSAWGLNEVGGKEGQGTVLSPRATLFRQRSQGTRKRPCSLGHRPGGERNEGAQPRRGSSPRAMKQDGRCQLLPKT